MQARGSRICGYFCIGLTSFRLKHKGLSDYTNIFSPNEYDKTDKVMLKYF